MKIILDRSNESLNAERLTIILNDDVEFHVRINQFGELVVQKSQFGDGETGLTITPSVSNEIRLK